MAAPGGEAGAAKVVPKRVRPSLVRVIAGLESKLQAQQLQLQQQLQENTRAKVGAEFLNTLTAVVMALQASFAQPGAGEPSAALAELARRAEALEAVVMSEAPAGVIAALPPPSPIDGWRLGAFGYGPAECIRRLLQRMRAPLDRDTHIENTRQRVHTMAMLLRHLACGDESARLQLQEVVTTHTIEVTAHFYQPWGPSLLPMNMETRAAGEPPKDIWRRILNRTNPSDWDQMGPLIANQWWKATAAVLTKERAALAQEALQHPDDLELQEAIATQLAEVNRGYMIYSTAASLLLATTFGTAEVNAETWVQAYPYWPILTAVLAEHEVLAAERAASARARIPGKGGSGSGSGCGSGNGGSGIGGGGGGGSGTAAGGPATA